MSNSVVGRRSLLKGGLAASGATVAGLAAATVFGADPASATTGVVLDGWYDVSAYGIVGDNTTDNTTAFRSLIATVVSNGGGTIYFPPGMYRFSSAQVNHPAGGNPGLINIPYVQLTSSQPMVSLEIVGATIPRGPAAEIATPSANTGAVLICETSETTSGGSVTNGNFINCGNGGAGYGFTWMNLTIRDLTFRLPNQTTWNGINAQYCAVLNLENVNVDISVSDTGALLPPSPNIGILTPINNNGAKTRVTNCGVTGYFYGFYLNEHSETDGLWAFYCQTAYNIPWAHHGLKLGRMQSVWCTRVLSATGGGTVEITGGPIDIEDAPTGHWYSPGTHVVDTSNSLLGDLSFVRVVAGVGKQNGPLTRSGAANLNLYNCADGVLPIRNASWIPTAGTGNGGYLFVQSGALKFCGSSGTVTTIAPA